ncbi:MAG: hypothetical protein M1825_005467 [Sarcosagium campestre]|nr:MAG: hypothetical protein M1825_005467 [Sarcosagium campestre]
MFSEYASRFLAQSQSRISSFRQPTDTGTETSRGTTDRQRQTSVGPSRFPISRSFLPRQAPGNPYPSTASQLSNFPFASRTSAAAPLFYSATDEFREEDDEVEREREVADFYALQRSRRHFGASQLEESSEVEDLGSRESDLDQPDSERAYHGRARRKRGGIRSSWRGGRVTAKGMARDADVVEEDGEDSNHEGESGKSSVAKGKMVDIGLDSSLKGSSIDGDHPPDDIAIEMPSDDPPAFQQFRNPPAPSTLFPGSATFVPYETDEEVAFERPRQPSSSASSAPPVVPDPTSTPRHDPFWASLFLICLAALFATFFLVFLHTSPPSKKRPLGDTIYSALRSSYHLLAVYTLVAVIVSLLWLSLIRSFVRPLTYVMLIGAPVVALSFSIYPLVASYNGRYHGSSGQDKAMRALSILPTVFAAFWLYGVYRGRHAFHKAIGILEWACRILVECPALLALGFATLAGVAIWTWVWLGMFTRVFLGGHVSPSRNLFIIDPGSWWLGASFVFMYLWTLAVGSGIQRATTAAAVSQWYFHRLAVPAPTSHQIVHAALMHATTTQLGTVCLSTLLTLLVRLPLLLLPRRATAFLSLFTHSLLPSSVAALTNPLTLTHAAIHSEPLAISARKLSQLTFLAPAAPTSSLHPRAFSRAPASSTSSAPLLPYRLAKLLLHTTRFVMALALGFGGWVSTARGLPVVATSSAAATAAAGTVRGSLYAYVVGLVAAAIGWAVLGAMEGVLGGVLDATVVCWAHDRAQGAAGGHCLEANYLFGDTR